jgi:hypothetical protein
MILQYIRCGLFLLMTFLVGHNLRAQKNNSISTVKIISLDSVKKNSLCNIDTGKVELKRKINGQVVSLKPDSNTWVKFLNPSVRGRIGVEGYYSTFQNPRMLNEPQYLRISGNTSVTIGGLPLLVDFYRTTEKQTLYNSNYIRAKFDYQGFLNGITKQWEQQLKSANARVSAAKYQNHLNSTLTGELEQQKGALLNEQEKLQMEIKEQQYVYMEHFQESIDSFEQLAYDSAKGLVHTGSDSIQQVGKSKKQRVDSMRLERLQRDTQRVAERLRQLEEKRRELDETKIRLDSTIAADTAKYNYYRGLLENPEASATAWLKDQGFPSQLVFFSKLKDFQTGVVNPYFHNYSLSGISMRGLQSTIGLGKGNLSLSGGKAIIADFSSYNRANSNYERLIVGTGFEWKINKSLSTLLFAHYANDPKERFTKENRIALQNAVIGLETRYQPKKGPLINMSYARSSYRITNTRLASTNYIQSGTYTFAQQTLSAAAYKLVVEKNITKGIALEGSTEMVGPRFKNLGNPFMRVNFNEHIVKTKFVIFKSQLNATAFYKMMRDNPLGINELTNRTSGYGLSLNTRFKNRKLPNFMASVSPYEQGNNHPDSLFRVNSKYSIVTAGMTYRAGKRSKYFIMVHGSQSKMQFTDTFSAVVRTLTVSQDLAVGGRLTIGLSSSFTRTFPSVDSTQANINQVRMLYRIGKSSNIGVSGFSSQFLNGSFRRGGSLIFSIPTGKHIKLSLKAGYDHYHKLWGIQDKEAIWGVCKVDCVF